MIKNNVPIVLYASDACASPVQTTEVCPSCRVPHRANTAHHLSHQLPLTYMNVQLQAPAQCFCWKLGQSRLTSVFALLVLDSLQRVGEMRVALYLSHTPNRTGVDLTVKCLLTRP